MDENDLNIIKSIMTHIHIILGRQNEKNFTFSSLQELYDKILLSMGPLEDNNSSYYKLELLESFNTSIEWMKKRGIIFYENDDEMGKCPVVRIDKEKLVKYIIDPENMELHSRKET